MLRLNLHTLASPLGDLLVVSDNDGTLRALDFHDYETRLHRLLQRHYGDHVLARSPVPLRLAPALEAYFSGDLRAADEVPVATGGTAFQCEVWAALRTIPPGSALTYGALAERIGRPTAHRAVGLANGANPIAIVVPCHRLIGADGSLTGYAGGIERKRWLLAHEGVTDVN